MKTVIFCLFLICVFWANVSEAADNGTGLLEECIQTERYIDDGEITPDSFAALLVCMSFIQGVIQSTLRYNELPPASRIIFLPENSIQNDQGVRIVLKYLRENPERLDELKLELVTYSLMSAFPC
ncbi:MAG: Rap1a/Tai family immunity protein [Gammaproteobacteria bacterium]|jgi:hypothetical protein|nr:Rap1a/Tai family immunity protein [Gammaproteobacteria bacterium]|tara:strand:- start:483 stop:857 length:375 start_codon:yes stop_codon:yes gene_type:complete